MTPKGLLQPPVNHGNFNPYKRIRFSVWECRTVNNSDKQKIDVNLWLRSIESHYEYGGVVLIDLLGPQTESSTTDTNSGNPVGRRESHFVIVSSKI